MFIYINILIDITGFIYLFIHQKKKLKAVEID